MNVLSQSISRKTLLVSAIAAPFALMSCHRNQDAADTRRMNQAASTDAAAINTINTGPTSDNGDHLSANKSLYESTANLSRNPPSTLDSDFAPRDRFDPAPGVTAETSSAGISSDLEFPFGIDHQAVPPPISSEIAGAPIADGDGTVFPDTAATPAPVVENEFAVATLQGAPGSQISGTVSFRSVSTDAGADVRVMVTVADATAGEHGLHIHEKGDCSAFAAGSAGSHWNPTNLSHGGPAGPTRHAGDLGNIVADANGAGVLSTTLLSVAGVADLRQALLGKAVILHEKTDDLVSQPAGNSGTPVACGVIKASKAMEAH